MNNCKNGSFLIDIFSGKENQKNGIMLYLSSG